MKKFWKISRTILVLFIATTAGAQAAFDPYASYLPQLLIYWKSPNILNEDYTSRSPMVASDITSSLTKCRVTGATTNVEITACQEAFNNRIGQMKNECDYLVAEEVKSYCSTTPSHTTRTHDCIVNNTTQYCDRPSGCRTLRFWVASEPDCTIHKANTRTKKCDDCYEDRKDNVLRDIRSNPPPGEIIYSQGCMPQSLKNDLMAGANHPHLNVNDIIQGGVTGLMNIFVPDCLTVTGNKPAFDKFENYADSDSDDFADTGTPQGDVYNNVDTNYKWYTDYRDPATFTNPKDWNMNPYKGNCGRGKFFYNNPDIASRDSNLYNSVIPHSIVISGTSKSNDIWESRTGCYNPEERFAIFPAGQFQDPITSGGTAIANNATTGVADTDACSASIKFNEPDRRVISPNELGILSGVAALSDQCYLNTYLRSIAAAQDPRTDTSRASDEVVIGAADALQGKPQGRDDGANGVKGQTNYLVPNDRILMRHPWCVKLHTATIDLTQSSIPAVDVLKDIGSRNKQMEYTKVPYDDERISQFGSLPVCLSNDSLDEMDNFCGHYLERANEFTQLKINNNPITIPLNLDKNYQNPRYVFNYSNFCWEKKTSYPSMLEFDRYEHWMPLAIRGVVPSGSPPKMRSDLFDETLAHKFVVTDYRRPTFTPYSARLVKDNQVADGTTVIAGKTKSVTKHTQYSLEEYGYGDTPILRTDYSFNPLNIYAPDSGQTFTPEVLNIRENMGRKAKMQQCISLYLEQWAFEGDKGAIVLDSNQRVISNALGAVTPDASMCQWVAYYDTSENYGREDVIDQRNAFKGIMLYYFLKLQEKNATVFSDTSGNYGDINLNLVGGQLNGNPPSVVGALTSWNAVGSLPGQDPERLRSDTVNDKNPLTNLFESVVGGKSTLNNMNDYGFRRRRGLRPEIFDYYNFLSFSTLAVMPEQRDVTNNTRVGDGNVFGDDLATVAGAVSQMLPSDSRINSLTTDLYTPVVPDFTNINSVTDMIENGLGWQVNMERRNCRSVVPPHFWKDVIKPPFSGCDYNIGSIRINSLEESMTPIGSPLTSVLGSGAQLMETAINSILGNTLTSDYHHWMTTDIYRPVSSLITPLPSLPVFAYGFNSETPFYFKQNWEKYELLGATTAGAPIYAADNWIGRAGGRPILNKHVLEKPWLTNGLTDKQNVESADDYSYFGGSDTYNNYKEVAKIVNPNARLGTIVLDEKNNWYSSKEWVEHTWPARSCMHLDPLDFGVYMGVPDLFGVTIQLPVGSKSVINEVADEYDITANPQVKNLKHANGRTFLSLDETSSNKDETRDAWKVYDDFDVGTMPMFNPLFTNSGTATTYTDNKQMGGFTVTEGGDSYFRWMPHAWSVAVGLNKAFWCEFEVPYQPFFTGDNEFDFDKTSTSAHFWINNMDNVIQKADKKEYNAAKPKLELYRVERIRDTCGPFGVRSTWVDDPNVDVGKWLLGKDNPAAKSRCAGWVDMHRRGVSDPKIIAWRLPRFDYEFLKAFVDCTGPVITPPTASGSAWYKDACQKNTAAFQKNKAQAWCEAAKAVANGIVAKYAPNSDAVECGINGLGSLIMKAISLALDGDAKTNFYNGGCLKTGCYKISGSPGNYTTTKWKAKAKVADNILRAVDYASRGDTYYGREKKFEGVIVAKTGNMVQSQSTSTDELATVAQNFSTDVPLTSAEVKQIINDIADMLGNMANLLSSMNTYISQIQTNLTNLTSDLVTLDSSLDNLNNTIASHSGGAVAGGSTACYDNGGTPGTAIVDVSDGIKTSVDTITNNRIKTLDKFESDLSDNVLGINVSFNSAKYKVSVGLMGAPNSCKTNPASQLCADTQKLDSDFTGIQTKVDSLGTDEDGIAANVTSITQSMLNISGDMDEMRSICAQIKGGRGYSNTLANVLGPYVTSAKAEITTMNGIITALNNTLTNVIQPEILAIQNFVSQASTDLSTVAQDTGNGGLASSIATAFSDINNVTGFVNDLATGGELIPVGDPNFSLEGFRGNASSAQVQNFWLKKSDGVSMFSEDDPFGFWCSCPADNPETTRCREDYCTTEQHVVLVGRNLGLMGDVLDWISGGSKDGSGNSMGHNARPDLDLNHDGTISGSSAVDEADWGYDFNNDGDMTDTGVIANEHETTTPPDTSVANNEKSSITTLATPIALAQAPGPYGRWLSCYYQARAKACPVLTREVSDTPSYSTVVDPFPEDKVLPDANDYTTKGHNFNVCTTTSPSGIGDAAVDQFLRWSREEPNHLARLPVWFESSGGGYRHQDLVFYTQVHDYDAPFMEMAVPFPIDLITRTASDFSGNTCDVKYLDTFGHCPNTDRVTNALGELNQREGMSDITYENPAGSSDNPTNEFDVAAKFEGGFKSSLLHKVNTSKIEPDYSSTQETDTYKNVYIKYIKGLYAAAKSYKHSKKALPPGKPGSVINYPNDDHTRPWIDTNGNGVKDSDDSEVLTGETKDDYSVNPRAEETIVGPRGCDIGGWYEMMLYQARCIKWFKLNCICDYDKTFARGNDVSFALRQAGMKFKVAYPSLNDPKAQVLYAKTPRGRVLMSFQKNQRRSNYGQLIPEDTTRDPYSTNLQSPLGNANDAKNTPAFTVQRDAKGRPQLTSGTMKVSSDREIVFPLADRGFVGPEFAAKSSTNTDYHLTGLDNVVVGDMIIWDETINEVVNINGANKPLDAGYPRHIAYVTSVNRIPAAPTGGSGATFMWTESIKVKEMNWGKNLDSCGNTDMWGHETIRTIYNPNLPSTYSLTNLQTIYENATIGSVSVPALVPFPTTIKGPLDRFASCQNADWAVCAEKNWSQVKIYRPYKIDIQKWKNGDTKPDGHAIPAEEYGLMKGDPVATPDSQYTKALCDVTATNFPQKLTLDRVLQLAANDPDIDAAVLSKATAAKDATIIAQYINTKIAAGAAHFSINEVLYGDPANGVLPKWKLMADIRSSAAYPIDEVEAFLNNPLYGTLDRCDPPVNLRDNYIDVENDMKNRLMVKPGKYVP